MATQIQASKRLTRKLSIANGLLSFAAFIIQGLATTWGFEAVGNQIVQTCLVVSAAISLYFLGSTSEKNQQDNANGK